MPAIVKAILATLFTLVLIMVLAAVEVVYTHGAITVGLMVCCVVGALGLLFYTIFDA